MKIRIISGVIGALLFAVVITASIFKPLILGIVLSALCALSVYELLNNTGLVKNKTILIAALLASVVLALSLVLSSVVLTITLTAFYFLVIVALTLKFHDSIDLLALLATFIAPIILSYAFGFIYYLFKVHDAKCFYFALIFAFSWGSDTMAYFTGYFFGKHKLCPNISPKKTIEGFIGGVWGSIIISLIVYLVFRNSATLNVTAIEIILLAAVFSVVGVMGDLFGSIIKRKTGIKDYGKIMPGHGGVLDRFDSVLLISPLFYLALQIFVL